MSQIQIQRQKNELAELIRSFKGRYIKTTGELSPDERTCVMGAIFQEFGYSRDNYDSYAALNRACQRYPELDHYIPELINKNNSGDFVGWEELAQFVERGFKD